MYVPGVGDSFDIGTVLETVPETVAGIVLGNVFGKVGAKGAIHGDEDNFDGCGMDIHGQVYKVFFNANFTHEQTRVVSSQF